VVATAREPATLPNDVFKRPGPHHALEVDWERVLAVRAAVAPLRRYGIAEPLAGLLELHVDELLGKRGFPELAYLCSTGDLGDFGLASYGPFLERAGLDLTFGESLIPHLAPDEAVSIFWAERSPYIPQFVAKARDVLARLPALRTIPVAAQKRVYAELTERADDADEPDERHAEQERQAPLLISAWLREYPKELDAFESAVRQIAERDGWVMTWASEQGWL
jgi:hypothetical protein